MLLCSYTLLWYIIISYTATIHTLQYCYTTVVFNKTFTISGIMSSYQKMLSYHYSDNSCDEKLSQFDKNYVQQKLQLGLARLVLKNVHDILTFFSYFNISQMDQW